ncbi:hypothetical protein CGLO_17702 [Colletotrichum gloeosporioides Cg-14]|uniref:Uncharacterized protein n=1 Tax=Colletotrichum gloeosporioides (strain Cg-14) TaxID=1237896 RepID=T0JT31_COLGC|nr:hypothetical protein CGLO_17702 [Colletotrichum gloeosporioides Cg-14]
MEKTNSQKSPDPNDDGKSYVDPSMSTFKVDYILEIGEKVVVTERGYNPSDTFVIVKVHPGNKYELKRVSDDQMAPNYVDKAYIQRVV